MTPRRVLFTPEARADLERLFDWIAEAAGPAVAQTYLARVERHCRSLALASERGQLRDDIRPGLRIIGFEKRLTLAFLVEEDTVAILRLFYAGRDWATELSG